MSTKLFIGNVPATMTSDDLVHMFQPFGEITECDIVKNYAFLHYESPDSATKAATQLNGREFKGNRIRVEVSHSRQRDGAGASGAGSSGIRTTKLFVGNVSPSATVEDLRKLFDIYGKITECDIVRDYAFVHFEQEQEADMAAEMLNGAECAGSYITVEKSRSRRGVGGGDADGCYNCGRPGHISRNCRGVPGPEYGGRGRGGRAMYGMRGPPPPRSMPMYESYGEAYDDYYHRSYYPVSRYEEISRRQVADRYGYGYEEYERPPVRSYRDPYERPPPYYYDTPDRRERDPYGERYRYAMRTREEIPRRRAPPPY